MNDKKLLLKKKVDKDLLSKPNYDKKIIWFDSEKFTNEVKRITKERNITQEQLFSFVEEKLKFSESKQKRWKAGKGGNVDWEDLQQFCFVTGLKIEDIMSTDFKDKIYGIYIQAREVSENNKVSDTDEYCEELKLLVKYFNYSDEYLTNLNVNFEKVKTNIKKLYEMSSQLRNERVERENEERTNIMKEKIRNEQIKRIETERKYKNNFDDYAILGNERIKLSFLVLNVLAYVCSTALLGPKNTFNVVLSISLLVLGFILLILRLFFKINVKQVYFDKYEKIDSDFMLICFTYSTITLLILMFNDINSTYSHYLNPCVDIIFILILIIEEIYFLKNIESVSKK